MLRCYRFVTFVVTFKCHVTVELASILKACNNAGVSIPAATKDKGVVNTKYCKVHCTSTVQRTETDIEGLICGNSLSTVKGSSECYYSSGLVTIV